MKERFKRFTRSLALSPRICRPLLRRLIDLHWKFSEILRRYYGALARHGGPQYPEGTLCSTPTDLKPALDAEYQWGQCRGKNVVWFMLDSLRYDVMKGYLNRGGFSTLREQGVFFDSTFSNGSWTYPSVFSFLSGLYPFNIGASKITQNNGAFVSECDNFNPQIPTIFDRLRKHGYEIRSLMDGWELLVGNTADQQFSNEYFNERWGQRFPRESYKSNPQQLFQHARLQLDDLAQMDEPFLLYFRSMSTHFKTGFNGFFKNLPEIEHLCRSGFASEVYRRLVDSLGTVEDGLINPVIQHLEKLGILDDTVIIIHSDHGDMLWNLEPDLQQNSKVGRWNMAAWTHNIEPYQGLIKVPLLISGTGLQGEIKDRFRLLDLTPTLLDVLDVPYDPMELDGHSLRYDKDRTLLYADSANYCELGGLSLQHQGQKLICSRRLGSVVYPVADQGYEEISTRDRDSKMVDVLRTFLLGHNQGMPSADDVDHEKILEDRLRGLGYI